MTEIAEPVAPPRARPTWSEETLAAKIELERASSECEDARNRWIGLELQLRDFDQEHVRALSADRLEDDPDVLRQRSRLTRLLSESQVELKRSEERLRDAGARHRSLVTRDEYEFRHEQLATMYETRAGEDRAREEARRRRRSLLGRLRR